MLTKNTSASNTHLHKSLSISSLGKISQVVALSIAVTLSGTDRTYSQEAPIILGNQDGPGEILRNEQRQRFRIKEAAVEHPHYYNVAKFRQYVRNNPDRFNGRGEEAAQAFARAYSKSFSVSQGQNILFGDIPVLPQFLENVSGDQTDGQNSLGSRSLSYDRVYLQQQFGLLGFGSDEFMAEINQEFFKNGMELQAEVASTHPDSELFGDINSYFQTKINEGEFLEIEPFADLEAGTHGEQDFIIAGTLSGDISPGERLGIENSDKIRGLTNDLIDLRTQLQQQGDINSEESQELRRQISAMEDSLKEEIETGKQEVIEAIGAMLEKQRQEALNNTPVYINGVRLQSTDYSFRKDLQDISVISGAITSGIMAFGGERDIRNAQVFQTTLDSALIMVDSINDIGAITELSSLSDIAGLATSMTNIIGAIGAVSSLFGGGGEAEMWEQLFETLNKLLEGQQKILEKLDTIGQNQIYMIQVLQDVSQSLSDIRLEQNEKFQELQNEHALLIQRVSVGDITLLDTLLDNSLQDAINGVSEKIDEINSGEEVDPSVYSKLYAKFNTLSRSIERSLRLSSEYRARLSNVASDLNGNNNISIADRTRLQNILDDVLSSGDMFLNIETRFPEICSEERVLCEQVKNLPDISMLEYYIFEVSKLVEEASKTEKGREMYENSDIAEVLSSMIEQHNIGVAALEKLLPLVYRQYQDQIHLVANSVDALNNMGLDIIFDQDKVMDSSIAASLEGFDVNGSFSLSTTLGEIAEETSLPFMSEEEKNRAAWRIPFSTLEHFLIRHEIITKDNGFIELHTLQEEETGPRGTRYNLDHYTAQGYTVFGPDQIQKAYQYLARTGYSESEIKTIIEAIAPNIQGQVGFVQEGDKDYTAFPIVGADSLIYSQKSDRIHTGGEAGVAPYYIYYSAFDPRECLDTIHSGGTCKANSISTSRVGIQGNPGTGIPGYTTPIFESRDFAYLIGQERNRSEEDFLKGFGEWQKQFLDLYESIVQKRADYIRRITRNHLLNEANEIPGVHPNASQYKTELEILNGEDGILERLESTKSSLLAMVAYLDSVGSDDANFQNISAGVKAPGMILGDQDIRNAMTSPGVNLSDISKHIRNNFVIPVVPE